MRYITHEEAFQIQEPCIVTLGKFDGSHRGHQKILKVMMEQKKRTGYKTAVFTFSMSPNHLVQGKAQTVITTNSERKNNLEKIGIDYLVEFPFTRETAHMSAKKFAAQILIDQMNAKVIVVGTDCSFGYQGAGNAALLEQMGHQYGYHLIVVQKEQDHNRDISSTYIREELDRGRIEKANELLGEPYSIFGEVVYGNQIGGSVLGFPTANLIPPAEKHLPALGVYVSRVLLEGKEYFGITNIGKKPTIEGENPTGVETYIYGINNDIYGENIEVQLLHFVRPEKKFTNLEQLKNQIGRDKLFGIDYLKKEGYKTGCF